MVRLLLNDALDGCDERLFQSHNGAIAALRASLRNNVKLGFNPTMVRLLLPRPYIKLVLLGSFNPTMVRLLQDPHKPCELTLISFNPTMVRLLQEDF